MSRDDQDAYFRRALDWLEERHGKENVLSAVIHRDDATPHMTVMTIPLDDRGRLNARALVGDRGKLSAMQTDFAERVGQPHGLERGVQGSKATHERVKSAYAHLQDPEHALELPERRTGGFLGRGKETDAEWRRRASEAATGALVGAWSARRREQRAHEVNILSLERQTIGTPEMKNKLDRLERENAHLSRLLERQTDEARTLQCVLRHTQIGRDTAITYARAVMQRAGIDETKVLPRMQDDIANAIAAYDAIAAGRVMIGRLVAQEALFYQLRPQELIRPDHLRIDQVLRFDDIRPQLAALYSLVGRPSIDPELMIRMLLVGHLYGIRSETRLCEEVHLDLAYRWFCRLGLEGRVPDRSSFSKNRHGRFAAGNVPRTVFELVVRRCMDAGLVGGAGARLPLAAGCRGGRGARSPIAMSAQLRQIQPSTLVSAG